VLPPLGDEPRRHPRARRRTRSAGKGGPDRPPDRRGDTGRPRPGAARRGHFGAGVAVRAGVAVGAPDVADEADVAG
jgi:hypothetical protein